MKYGQLAGNKKINSFIYLCFDYICEADEQKFVKKFKKLPQTSDQILHTFRELILGAYLSNEGFKVRHDYLVEGKTPDWCILSSESSVIGVVELLNFHIDKLTENDIEHQREKNKIACFWRDGRKDNIERLYQCIWAKVAAYKSLASKLCIPFIVAIFCDFRAAIDFKEVQSCLYDKEKGLFGMYPDFSGTLFFHDNLGQYLFDYSNNPHAKRNFDIPEGIFPPGNP